MSYNRQGRRNRWRAKRAKPYQQAARRARQSGGNRREPDPRADDDYSDFGRYEEDCYDDGFGRPGAARATRQGEET